MNEIITVVGAGYVGVTTASVLANSGYKTYLLDTDENKINKLKSKQAPFYEAGLDDFIDRGITIGNLIPTVSYEEAIQNSSIVFICVGTPSDEDGASNLSYVFNSIETIIKTTTHDLILVQKSTVPVETGKNIKKIIKENNSRQLKINLISCPEFLREASAVFDTLFFDRLVISNEDKESTDRVIDLYKNIDSFSKIVDYQKLSGYAFSNRNKKYIETLPKFEDRIIKTEAIESAELIKVTANSFLALKISFANNVARLCDKVGANSTEVMDGIGHDNRIGRSFLYPGLGFSGGCFPKDISGMINTANEHEVRFGILEEVIDINRGQINIATNKIKELIGDLENKTITILGLSFKPGTSDIRKAQSIYLIKRLLKQGAIIKAFDPRAINEAKKELNDKNLTYTDSIESACENSNCIVIATEWNEFINFDYSTLQCRNVVDCRNCLNKKALEEKGFNYIGF